MNIRFKKEIVINLLNPINNPRVRVRQTRTPEHTSGEITCPRGVNISC